MTRRGTVVRIAVVALSTSLIVAFAIQGARANLQGCSECIEAGDIARGAVRSSELKNGGVQFEDLATGTVKRLRPRMWASMDGTEGGQDFTPVDTMTLNTVTFTAPRAGFLVVEGQVYVNNREASAVSVTLQPNLDGTPIQPGEGGWSGWLEAGATGANAAGQMTFDYRVASAVTAGEHTIENVVDGGGNDLYLDRNNLIVMFFPSGNITTSDEA